MKEGIVLRIVIVSLLFLFSTANATIWYVHPDSTLNSIQAGIDSSSTGDTVLVAKGTYFENINFNGKNIVVGSMFLTTGNTSYISSTTIDGDSSGSVVTFENGEDSTAVITGFTIQNGSAGYGGGIYCVNESNPTIIKITIRGNTADYGGGFYCRYSSPKITKITICGNTASVGGGIYCSSSNLILYNVTISGNTGYYGGGICCSDSNPHLENVIISKNTASSEGGGIYCNHSYPSLTNVTISRNTANSGGGIYFDYYGYSHPSFDSVNRCNIYQNIAYTEGCDLCSKNYHINIIVDTFTVLQPDNNLAHRINKFTFDILNGKVEQINKDLYVSPNGSDDNSGLNDGDPLLTVSYALVKILADSTNPHTIYLANGTYSPSQTGEIFPLKCRSYVSLQGETENSTILDGEGLNEILLCKYDSNFSIENMTIQNGKAHYNDGGGIYMYHSNPILNNVTISGNNAIHTYFNYGGGIYCEKSSPSLYNVTISGNTADYGGGFFCRYSRPSLSNVIISGNTADYGGGINCSGNYILYLKNVIISENTASEGGGIRCWYSHALLANVTISGNVAYNSGGGIYCMYSSPGLKNCILWNDTPDEIFGTLNAYYSCIQGGWPGTGNIDADPVFVSGPLSNYHLCPFTPSPCIDAGHPDTQYNDPEDPLIPGYAMWPALGTIRNDMGVYGGPGTEVWTGVEEEIYDEELFTFSKAYPNPFMDKTMIKYNLPSGSNVNIAVYNVIGSRVNTLLNKRQNPGRYTITWDGRDERGNKPPSGFYFLRFEAGEYKGTRKLLLIR